MRRKSGKALSNTGTLLINQLSKNWGNEKIVVKGRAWACIRIQSVVRKIIKMNPSKYSKDHFSDEKQHTDLKVALTLLRL
jgi:hypothetical protein